MVWSNGAVVQCHLWSNVIRSSVANSSVVKHMILDIWNSATHDNGSVNGATHDIRSVEWCST